MIALLKRLLVLCCAVAVYGLSFVGGVYIFGSFDLGPASTARVQEASAPAAPPEAPAAPAPAPVAPAPAQPSAEQSPNSGGVRIIGLDGNARDNPADSGTGQTAETELPANMFDVSRGLDAPTAEQTSAALEGTGGPVQDSLRGVNDDLVAGVDNLLANQSAADSGTGVQTQSGTAVASEGTSDGPLQLIARPTGETAQPAQPAADTSGLVAPPRLPVSRPPTP